MHSSSIIFQALAVFIGTSSLATAAMHLESPLLSVPLMPRIPSLAKHVQMRKARASMKVDLRAVAQVQCLDSRQEITVHDESEAQLSICGGMPGVIERCLGSPATTEASTRTAKFTLSAVSEGARITMTKDRWMSCVQAARETCPTGSLSAVCVGAASTGDVAFTLANP